MQSQTIETIQTETETAEVETVNTELATEVAEAPQPKFTITDVNNFIVSLSAAPAFVESVLTEINQLNTEIKNTKAALKAAFAKSLELDSPESAEAIGYNEATQTIAEKQKALNDLKAKIKLIKNVSKAVEAFQKTES